jgi:hypothetical protein
VSLKAREFTYLKFPQIINSTIHQILSVGCSSIELSVVILEYRIDLSCRKVGILAKTAVSLHRCAMITIVFFDPLSDFAKFIALS